MAQVSITNGNTYCNSAQELREEFLKCRHYLRWNDWDEMWEELAYYMEDEAREQTAIELAPCTDDEFLDHYLELAPCDLVIG